MPTEQQLKRFESAIRTGIFEDVHNLLLAGCDPTATDRDGWTNAGKAIKFGRSGVIQIMLDHGLDPRLSGAENITLLHVAAMFDRPAIAKMLLRGGADPRVADDNGHTPLTLCRNDALFKYMDAFSLENYDGIEDPNTFEQDEQVYCADKNGYWWAASIKSVRPGGWFDVHFAGFGKKQDRTVKAHELLKVSRQEVERQLADRAAYEATTKGATTKKGKRRSSGALAVSSTSTNARRASTASRGNGNKGPRAAASTKSRSRRSQSSSRNGAAVFNAANASESSDSDVDDSDDEDYGPDELDGFELDSVRESRGSFDVDADDDDGDDDYDYPISGASTRRSKRGTNGNASRRGAKPRKSSAKRRAPTQGATGGPRTKTPKTVKAEQQPALAGIITPDFTVEWSGDANADLLAGLRSILSTATILCHGAETGTFSLPKQLIKPEASTNSSSPTAAPLVSQSTLSSVTSIAGTTVATGLADVSAVKQIGALEAEVVRLTEQNAELQEEVEVLRELKDVGGPEIKRKIARMAELQTRVVMLDTKVEKYEGLQQAHKAIEAQLTREKAQLQSTIDDLEDRLRGYLFNPKSQKKPSPTASDAASPEKQQIPSKDTKALMDAREDDANDGDGLPSNHNADASQRTSDSQPAPALASAPSNKGVHGETVASDAAPPSAPPRTGTSSPLSQRVSPPKTAGVTTALPEGKSTTEPVSRKPPTNAGNNNANANNNNSDSDSSSSSSSNSSSGESSDSDSDSDSDNNGGKEGRKKTGGDNDAQVPS